ncbi:prolyl oligopeptidase family serine peptidase [Patescibacteria group bacterium]|nr:prolyl oligopeptidase family serine peptidase [Patescibacteria group bacterium]
MFFNLFRLSDTKLVLVFLLLLIFVLFLILNFGGYGDYIIGKVFFEKYEGGKEFIINEVVNQEFYHYPESKVLWVIVPSWGEEIDLASTLKEVIIEKKSSFLRYKFPKGILSDDYNLTAKYFNEINDLIISDIKELKDEYNFSEINIIGASIGTSNTFTIVNKESDLFNKMVVIVPGNSLAKSMWNGILTSHLRKSYEAQAITLEVLEDKWKDFAPQNNLDNLKGKDIYIRLSKSDKIIPYSCGSELVKKMEEKGIIFKLQENSFLGHYGTIYNAYFYPDYLD